MKFYRELSRVYDIVFPEDPKTLSFLSKEVKSSSVVLDLACGTGTYAIPLAMVAGEVYGIDLSQEMIDLAKTKCHKENLHFFVHDMTRFNEVLPENKFDLIYCIGNSMVHLDSKEAITCFLKSIYGALSEDGELIIQIVNYDRVAKYDVKSLPTIDRTQQGVKFERRYNFRKDEGLVDFNTELTMFKVEKADVFENTVTLLALFSDELKLMLENSGFRDVNLFGSFEGAPFSDQAFSLIVKAKK